MNSSLNRKPSHSERLSEPMSLNMRPSADLPLHFQDPSEELHLHDRDSGMLPGEAESNRRDSNSISEHDMDSYSTSRIDESRNSDDKHAEDHSSNRRESATKQPTKSYECQYCGWKFNLKANLLAHVRRHTGEKPYSCTHCSRKFTQSSLLTVHMRTHTGERPFKCPTCDRWFSRSGNLLTHMRTHTNVKPYVCTFCSKGFAQRVNMELHTRIHTGVKPYRCGVCERAFTSCSNMRRHWKQIHPDFPGPNSNSSHASTSMLEKALLYSEDIPHGDGTVSTDRIHGASGLKSSFEPESSRSVPHDHGEHTNVTPEAAGQHNGQIQPNASLVPNENVHSMLPIAPQPVQPVDSRYPQYSYVHPRAMNQLNVLSSSSSTTVPRMSLPPIQQASTQYSCEVQGMQMQDNHQKRNNNYTALANSQQTMMGSAFTPMSIQQVPQYGTYGTPVYSSLTNNAVSTSTSFPLQVTSAWGANNKMDQKHQGYSDNMMVYSTQLVPSNDANQPQDDHYFPISEESGTH